MTFDELVRRLGLPAHHVLATWKHPAGLVVTVRGGRLMLVTDTVVRPYVPEVDDVQVEAEPEPAAGPVAVEPKPKRQPKRSAIHERSA